MGAAATLPLAGLSVLVTRPAAQGALLSQHIRDQGGCAILFPTLVIADPLVHPPAAHICPLLRGQLAGIDTLIFTSPNSVIKTHRWMQVVWGTAYWACWQRCMAGREIFAMGAGTQAALVAVHCAQAIVPATETWGAAALLALPALQAVQGRHMMIFAGEGGRKAIGRVLTQRGAVITWAYSYRQTCPSVPDLPAHLAAWEAADIQVIVSTSCASLRCLCRLLTPLADAWLKQRVLLVISLRMQRLARTLGFQRIICAKNAQHASIMAALASI